MRLCDYYPGRKQPATFGVNEQRGKQETKMEAEQLHHTYQDSTEEQSAQTFYWETAERVKTPEKLLILEEIMNE